MDLIDIDRRYSKILINIDTNMSKIKSTQDEKEKEKLKADIDRELFFMNFLSIEAKKFDENISNDIQKTYKTFQSQLYEPTKQNQLKFIENDIKNIHNIFNDIHLMVYQQNENLNRIEDNIIDTQNKIEKAEEELSSIGTSIKTKVYTILFITLASFTGITLLR